MQLTVYDFVQPFGGALDPADRWVRLAAEIDWEALERKYAAHFGKGGAVALPVRLAFGSLVIRQALGLSDRQTVELIRESPYLQYFIGLSAFTSEPPFSAHSMAAFRRRFSKNQVTRAARLAKKYTYAPRPGE